MQKLKIERSAVFRESTQNSQLKGVGNGGFDENLENNANP